MSLGLVLLTCALLSAGDLLGLLRAQRGPSAEERVRFAEMLASQASAAAAREDLRAIRVSLQMALRRGDALRSAGLRAIDGRLLIEVGPHRALWEPGTGELTTELQASIPLFRAGQRWATLELRFPEVRGAGWLRRLLDQPLVRLLGLVIVAGFTLYLLYLRRSLRHLDPSAVVPARVRTTLDVMAEGVLLIDSDERVVLANAAFASACGRDPGRLLGTKASSLPWRSSSNPGKPARLPWQDVLEEGRTLRGAPLGLETERGELRVLMVNSSPVLDGWGRAKGAIVTFDDVTELERKTGELERALAELESSRQEIEKQHERLRGMGRRDPLTGVSNRRSFLEALEAHFAVARAESRELSCVMIEIADFRRLNSEHGVAVGDSLIRAVAEALATEVRATDAVGRYDGVRFCVAMADAAPEIAGKLVERLARRVTAPGFARATLSLHFGISSLRSGAATMGELLRQAEEALEAPHRPGTDPVRVWEPGRDA
jgi:diguanylate cyclase (GGDEF)-like protein/PAS domain S-box-containing protein